MSDLIDRQAAMSLAKDICVPIKNGTVYKHRCIDPDAIKELPSAQPEIIRCKDCLMHGVCRFEQGLGLRGYCSRAERREE